VLYVFSLILLHGFITYFDNDYDAAQAADAKYTREEIMDTFGGVWRTMLTLYMAMTGGQDWEVYYDVVEVLGTFYVLVFIFFTFFFSFALFNILTGVFVEKAVVAAQPDREELILQQRRKVLQEAEEFRRLCERLDKSKDGTITLEEFKENMQDEDMIAYMASVGLEIHDVTLFFNVIGGKGEVSLDRFVEGCMSMRGNATALDVQKTIYKTEKLGDRIMDLQKEFRSQMDAIVTFLRVAPTENSIEAM
jgi:hypothetical protein